METLPGFEIVRNVAASPTLMRAADAGVDGLGKMFVNFSEFDAWYEISSYWEGSFMERTAKGAFTKTIKERRDAIKVLFDHGYDPSIGNKVLGPIRSLEEKSSGPAGEVDLFDTSYNRDLLPGLQSGVYGSSFRFSVTKETWDDDPGASEHNPKGLPERTIQEVKLFEFGPVTFPASEAATSGMRSSSGTDGFYELAATRSERTEGMLSRARALREPDARSHHSRSRDQRRASALKRGIIT